MALLTARDNKPLISTKEVKNALLPVHQPYCKRLSLPFKSELNSDKQ